jgi:hypothetical protein
MTPVLLLVGTGWMYVVLMMSAAEATSPNGSVLGALFTFVLYGAAPLSLALYLLATPARRRRRKAKEAAAAASVTDPSGSGHAAGDAVAPVREEP